MRQARRAAGLPQQRPGVGGRYLRYLISGERSGADIWKKAQSESKEKGLYQILWRGVDGIWYSQNISAAGATSAFDIPAIEAELRTGQRRTELGNILKRFQERYQLPQGELDPERFVVRMTRQQRVQPTIRVVLT